MAKSEQAAPPTRDSILKDLATNTTARQRVARSDTELLDERDTLFLAAREAEPPIVVREIAEITKLTEVAVNKRLKQLRDAGR